MPIGRPMATSDPNARSRITTAATRPTSSPTPVAGSSKAKNRSPPISIRRPRVRSRPSAAERLEARRGRGGELLEHRVLQPQQRDPAVGRDRPRRAPRRRRAASAAGSSCRARRAARRRPGARRARRGRGVENVARRRRRDDDLRGQAGLRRSRPPRAGRGLLRVQAGHREGVLERRRPKRCGRADHDDRERRARRRSTAHGRRAANRPSGTGRATSWCSSESAVAGGRRRCSPSRGGPRPHRPRARPCPADRPIARSSLSADAPRRGSLRWAVMRDAVRSLWAEPRAPDPPGAGLARLGAGRGAGRWAPSLEAAPPRRRAVAAGRRLLAGRGAGVRAAVAAHAPARAVAVAPSAPSSLVDVASICRHRRPAAGLVHDRRSSCCCPTRCSAGAPAARP